MRDEPELVELARSGAVDEAVKVMVEEGTGVGSEAFQREVDGVRREVVERLQPYADPWEGPLAVQRWYLEAGQRDKRASAEAKAVRFRVWADLGLGLNSQFLGNGTLPDGTSEWWVPNVALSCKGGHSSDATDAPFAVIDLASS